MAKCNRCLDEGTLYNGEAAGVERPCPDCRGIDTSPQDAEYAAWTSWQPESVPDKRDAHCHGFDAGVQFAARHLHQDVEALREDADEVGRLERALWEVASALAPETIPGEPCLPERVGAIVAEVERLREALMTARRRVRQMHGAGFDSRRREIATDAICEIDQALAPSPDDRGGERGPEPQPLESESAPDEGGGRQPWPMEDVIEP